MRVAIIFLLAIHAGGCGRPLTPVQSRGEFIGKVVKVIDGDTNDVLHCDKITTRVRLNGIDAPERKQPFSTKAKERLSELIGEQPIRVVDRGPDRYGRTIGDVYSADKLLNLELVRDGFAWHFKRYSSDPHLRRQKLKHRLPSADCGPIRSQSRRGSGVGSQSPKNSLPHGPKLGQKILAENSPWGKGKRKSTLCYFIGLSIPLRFARECSWAQGKNNMLNKQNIFVINSPNANVGTQLNGKSPKRWGKIAVKIVVGGWLIWQAVNLFGVLA